jgi:hypothetical protein
MFETAKELSEKLSETRVLHRPDYDQSGFPGSGDAKAVVAGGAAGSGKTLSFITWIDLRCLQFIESLLAGRLAIPRFGDWSNACMPVGRRTLSKLLRRAEMTVRFVQISIWKPLLASF